MTNYLLTKDEFMIEYKTLFGYVFWRELDGKMIVRQIVPSTKIGALLSKYTLV